MLIPFVLNIYASPCARRVCILLLFFFSLPCADIYAQDIYEAQNIEGIIPPSPNAQAIGEYGRSPVSLYNGTPQVSVPIMEAAGKYTNMPISLDYHASGIRVDQLASSVGLGWSLNAGGAITREIRDQPDDANQFTLRKYCLICSECNNCEDCIDCNDCIECQECGPASCFKETDKTYDEIGYLYTGPRIHDLQTNGFDPNNSEEDLYFLFGHWYNIVHGLTFEELEQIDPGDPNEGPVDDYHILDVVVDIDVVDSNTCRNAVEEHVYGLLSTSYHEEINAIIAAIYAAYTGMPGNAAFIEGLLNFLSEEFGLDPEDAPYLDFNDLVEHSAHLLPCLRFDVHRPIPDVYDTEPDLFSFNFGGYTGSFVFDETGGVQLFSDHDLKIEYSLSSTLPIFYDNVDITSAFKGGISQFFVTTPDGTQYLFDQREVAIGDGRGQYVDIANQNLPLSECNPLLRRPYQFNTFDVRAAYTTWYLSKVINPIGKIEMELQYQNETVVDHNYLTQNLSNCGGFDMRVSSTVHTTLGKRIKNISWGDGGPVDYGSLSFNYTGTRQDLYYPNNISSSVYARPLSEIVWSGSDDIPIKKYVLNHDYYAETPINCNNTPPQAQGYVNAHRKRLKLCSVQEISATDATSQAPHVFEYDNTPMPPRHSPKRDFWGFYNGIAHHLVPTVYIYENDPNSDVLQSVYSIYPRQFSGGGGVLQDYIIGANRSPNENTIRAGILNKIIYPTGGTTTYEYEQHQFLQYEFYPIQNTGGGLRVNKITTNPGYGEDMVKTFKYKFPISSQFPNEVESGKLVDLPSFARYKSVACSSDPDESNSSIKDNTIMSSGAFTGLTTTKGSHVAYGCVQELYENNGRIEHYFHLPATYGVDTDECVANECIYERSYVVSNDPPLQVDNYPFPPNPNYDWNRGSLDKQVYYNESNIKLRQIDYEYEIFDYKKTYAFKVAVDKDPFFPVNYRGVYYYLSGDKRLVKTTTSDFGSNGLANIVLEEHTEYSSSDHHFPTASWLVNSDNKTHRTEYNYVYDNPNTAINADRINRYMIATPIETIKLVDGVPVDGQRMDYDFFSATTGAYQGNIFENNAFPALHKVHRYEKTWDANGNPSAGVWDLQSTIDKYNTEGFPETITKNHWQTLQLEWLNGLLKKRTFLMHESHYNYDSNTRLLTQMIDVDGQVSEYEYDGLLRQSQIRQRNNNVVTDIEYVLQINGFPLNLINTTTSYTNAINSDLQQMETKQYLDGLGRQIQSIQVGHTENNKDLIVVQEYDHQGRLSKVYEAFEGPDDSGYYNSNYSSQPYTLTTYEASPLNRPTSLTPPNWYATSTNYASNMGISIYSDDSNTYDNNQLYTNIVTDPNNHQYIRYTDKLGREVATQRLGASESALTNCLYDDKNRIRYKYPPGTSPISNTPELIFEYVYNKEDNVIEQKVPDQAPINYLYNDRQLQAGMRNGILEDSTQWLVTDYDFYGRPLQTGLYNGTFFNTDAPVFNSVLNKYYYDGSNGITIDNAPQYMGKLKKSSIKLLDDHEVNNTFVDTEFFYDVHGRVSTTEGNNHNNTNDGSEMFTYQYDWADNVTAIHRDHYAYNTVRNIRERTMYDHQGRAKDAYHWVIGNNEQHLCNWNYTAKNEVLEKNLSLQNNGLYLQSIDYTYNEQGWLTKINNKNTNPANAPLPICSPIDPGTSNNAWLFQPVDANDLFHLELKYDTGVGLGASPQKNGNIATVYWQTRGRKMQGYGLTYDYQDRLISATHGEEGPLSNMLIEDYYSTVYSYDIRGNLLTLSRNGFIVPPNSSCGTIKQIDDLWYEYYDHSNRVKRILDDVVCDDYIMMSQPNTWDGIHAANIQVTANNMVMSDVDATYQAEECVELQAGFEFDPADQGGSFLAQIAPCMGGSLQTDQHGFIQRSEEDYLYDSNGNMIFDPNKDLHFQYNFLNLPYRIASSDGTKEILIQYDANGTKLSREIKLNEQTLYKQDYINGIEYKDGIVEAVYHAEGRAYNTNANGSIPDWQYQFDLKDHLGNTRISFADVNGNGIVDFEDGEILLEAAYYPFGMRFSDNFREDAPTPTNYLYNGKKFYEDFGVNLNDYGARNYDAAVGRWWSIDPLAEQRASLTPYNYVQNNPILRIDPTGMIDTVRVGNDGIVVNVVEHEGENVFIDDATNNVIETNDPSFDQLYLGGTYSVGDQLYTNINEELLVNLILEGTLEPFIYNSTGQKSLALSSAAKLSHGQADFPLNLANEFDLYVDSDGRTRTARMVTEIQGNLFRLGQSTTLYNPSDAGQYLWGAWMRLNGFSFIEVKLGSNLNELSSFGDSAADQRAITNGFFRK